MAMATALATAMAMAMALATALALASATAKACCKPPRYVPYKGTYVPYKGIYDAHYQGQMLDVQEGQTAKSALRDDWTRNVSHHTH